MDVDTYKSATITDDVERLVIVVRICLHHRFAAVPSSVSRVERWQAEFHLQPAMVVQAGYHLKGQKWPIGRTNGVPFRPRHVCTSRILICTKNQSSYHSCTFSRRVLLRASHGCKIKRRYYLEPAMAVQLARYYLQPAMPVQLSGYNLEPTMAVQLAKYYLQPAMPWLYN